MKNSKNTNTNVKLHRLFQAFKPAVFINKIWFIKKSILFLNEVSIILFVNNYNKNLSNLFVLIKQT